MPLQPGAKREGVDVKKEEKFAALLDTFGAVVFFAVAFLCYLSLSVAWGAGMP